MKRCRWCQKPFEPKTENQLSCSAKCTGAYWAWKRPVARIRRKALVKRRNRYLAGNARLVTRAALSLAAEWLAEKRRIIRGIRPD
jgi:hypothetical protein